MNNDQNSAACAAPSASSSVAQNCEPASNSSLVGYTDALVRGLDILLVHHECPWAARDSLKNQLHEYLDSSLSIMVWFKRAKYTLTLPMSRYLRNEPPPPPDLLWSPSGIFLRWAKPRLLCFNRRNTHLWYSWLQSKRAADALPEEVINDTYKKHFQTLTKPDTGDDAVIEMIFQNPAFEAVLDYTSRLVGERFARSDYLDFGASNSACFESSRGQGGQYEYLRTITGASDSLVHRDDLISMTDFIGCYYGKFRLSVSVIEKRQSVVKMYAWESLAGVDENKVEPLSCTIQAVLEPLKVRVISKGNGKPYYEMRPLQRALHSTLKEMPWFRLIGRPMSPTDLIDIALRKEPTEQWFSIDYSAATDGLSWKYSRRILERVTRGLPKRVRNIALRVLGPHRLHYPIGKDGEDSRDPVFWGMQTNGQLMGSVLSFPVLCLANLGLCLLSKIGSVPGDFLINGDDAAYTGDESTWQRHVDFGRRIGLEMSVGKAYRHMSYVNVNSTCFHYDLSRENETPYQIPFLNTGLIIGQHKVMENTKKIEIAKAHMSQDAEKPLTANVDEILRGSLPGKQCELLAYLIKTRSEDLKQECKAVLIDGKKRSVVTRNIFVSKSLGGMGVVPPSGFKYRISETDRLLASGCLPEMDFDVGRPLRSGDLLVIDEPMSSPWLKISSEHEGLPVFRVDRTRPVVSNWLLKRHVQARGLFGQSSVFVESGEASVFSSQKHNLGSCASLSKTFSTFSNEIEQLWDTVVDSGILAVVGLRYQLFV